MLMVYLCQDFQCVVMFVGVSREQNRVFTEIMGNMILHPVIGTLVCTPLDLEDMLMTRNDITS